MDIALHRANDHLAHGLRPGCDQQGFENRHAGLHGVGSQKHFGDEENAVPEVNSHNGHSRHQRFVQSTRRRPAPTQKDSSAFIDFFGQTIIEVVVHLSDKIFVG